MAVLGYWWLQWQSAPSLAASGGASTTESEKRLKVP